VQTLEAVGSNWLIDLFNSNNLSALASRLSRQQEKLTLLQIDFKISSMLDAENFKDVLQACPRVQRTVYIGSLEVDEPIGRKGWELVAESVQMHPGEVVGIVETSKEALDGGRKEDVRVIWEAIKPSGFWSMMHYTEPVGACENIRKEDEDAAWERLEHVLDVSIEEWRAENEEWLRHLREVHEEEEAQRLLLEAFNEEA